MSDLYDSTQCVCVCVRACVCVIHARANRSQITPMLVGRYTTQEKVRLKALPVTGSALTGWEALKLAAASWRLLRCVCVHARARAHDRVQARGEAPHACACVQRRGEVEVDGPCDRHRRHMKSH